MKKLLSLIVASMFLISASGWTYSVDNTAKALSYASKTTQASFKAPMTTDKKTVKKTGKKKAMKTVKKTGKKKAMKIVKKTGKKKAMKTNKRTVKKMTAKKLINHSTSITKKTVHKKGNKTITNTTTTTTKHK